MLTRNFQPPSAALFREMYSASHGMQIYRKRCHCSLLPRKETSEQKPRTNGNIGSVVKQHTETTGHDIHPNYANIVETGMKIKNKRLFLESLHSFLTKNSVNERAPFPRVYASLVSSLRSNKKQWYLFLYICIPWVAEYISLKKAAEGGWKFSFHVFRSILTLLF